jgi:dTDP-glucose pyrophosphorylase
MPDSMLRIGVIPAAGMGRRMGYLSHLLPKCLFPLYDRPILDHVIQNMTRVGIEQVYLIVNYQSSKIREYLRGVRSELHVRVKLVEQESLHGIAHALMLTKERVREPFFVILGDDCTITPSLGNIVEAFFRKKAIAVEAVTHEPNPELIRASCCVGLEKDGKISRIVEKPSHPFSDLRGCGIYVFDPVIFDYIKMIVPSVTGGLGITDVIGKVAGDGRAFGEFIDGINVNINSYQDLLRASLAVKQNLELDRQTGKAGPTKIEPTIIES